MKHEAAMRHAIARILDDVPSDQVVAELVEMGASERTARQAVGDVEVQTRARQARTVAVSLLEQGESAAGVWNALVSRGMDGAEVETLVRELLRAQEAAEVQRRRENDHFPAARWFEGGSIVVGVDGVLVRDRFVAHSEIRSAHHYWKYRAPESARDTTAASNSQTTSGFSPSV